MKIKHAPDSLMLCIVGTLLLAVLLAACTPATPQVRAAGLENVNPKRSNLAPTEPDAATGGRVNGLAVSQDGKVYYLASEWGGLYKSVDGGKTWFHLDQHLPTVTWDVAVDPGDSNRVYATSFYDGRVNSIAGINISTDGGVTWTHPAGTLPPQNFCVSEDRRREPTAYGIAVDPDNPAHVTIGTNCGLAVSSDSGANWSYIDPSPTDPANNIWDVTVHHNGIIDLCGDDGHQRSLDGGITWTGAIGIGLPGGHCSIVASPFEKDVLVAVTGISIYESDDGGATWPFYLKNLFSQGRIPFVEVNKRAGSDFDLWFGDTTLFRTTCTQPAGGTGRRCQANNWIGPFTRTAGGHDDVGDILFDPTQEVDACPLLFSSDGGVYLNTRTTPPNCQSPLWEQPEITPNALWVFGMTGADVPGIDPEDLYFATQDNGTFSTRDAGKGNPTWKNNDCCDSHDIIAKANQVLYSACCWSSGRANRLFLRNAGLTGGGEINTYPPGNIPGFRAIDGIDTFGTDKYVVVTTMGVYFTDDIGANPIVWNQLGTVSSTPSEICNIRASVPAGTPGFTIQAVQNGICDDSQPLQQRQLWRINDATTTATWIQVNPPNGIGGFGIYAVDPTNPDRLLASHLQNNSDPAMVISTDGGGNWASLPTLDTLMTGNGVFLYQTTRGSTYFTSVNGYPQPSFAAFDPSNHNVIMAGGVDSGIFLSLDAGGTWKLVSDPFTGNVHIPRPQFAYFDHEPANVTTDVVIYIGTIGRGVWRLRMPAPPSP